MAADEMEKEGKLRPAIIDSRTTSMALGFLTTKVAELNLQGMSAIDIQKYVEDMKKRTFAMVALPTIKYVAAGGRWLAGTLLQIKPILMVHSGKIEEVAKVRTWENTKERFLKIIQPMEFEQVAVMFSNNYTEAEEFKARVPAPRSNEVLVRQMGSTITTHAGKQVLAVCGILTSQSPVLTPAEAAKIKY
jgi:DegV family protein with EDD domain